MNEAGTYSVLAWLEINEDNSKAIEQAPVTSVSPEQSLKRLKRQLHKQKTAYLKLSDALSDVLASAQSEPAQPSPETEKAQRDKFEEHIA